MWSLRLCRDTIWALFDMIRVPILFELATSYSSLSTNIDCNWGFRDECALCRRHLWHSAPDRSSGTAQKSSAFLSFDVT